ncbi:acyltransferase family protein [Streptomyces sp. NPDC058274]|uniref:acyltransferase family protein n=1 Tax=Streptomyces sp. NPDC058274 TaxID=3346416 RepID=UPI0036EE9114
MSTAQVTGTGRGGNLPGLALARLPASFFILTSHIVGVGLFADQALQSHVYGALSKIGYTSVSFFIVLSGFVLTWTSRGTALDWRRFMSRRVVKVIPVHLIAWVICLALFAATTFPLGTILANLFLVQAWVPDHTVYFAVNNPAWTLSVEICFYVAFPLLYGLLVKRSTRTLRTLTVLLTAAVVALPFVLSLFPDGTTFRSPGMNYHGRPEAISEWKFWLVYICPAARMAESVLGMLIALLLKRGAWPRIPRWSALVVLAPEIYVATEHAHFVFATSAVTITGIVLLIGAVGAGDLRRAPERAAPALSRFGRFTFGVYMYQWPLLWMWYLHRSGEGYSGVEALIVYAGVVALTVVATYLSYQLVEKPLDQRWRRKNASPRPAPAPTPATCADGTRTPAAATAARAGAAVPAEPVHPR